MSKKIILLALLPVFAVYLIGCGSGSRTSPLPDVPGDAGAIGLNGQLAMFTLVRESMKLYPDLRRVLELPRDPDLPKICDRPVIVSAYHENSPPLWGVGQQKCLYESTLEAVYNLTKDKNFRKYYLTALDKLTVRIDILNGWRRIKFEGQDLGKISFEPGLYGLMLQNGKQLTIQPSFHYLIYSWEGEARGKNMRAKRMELQLKYLADQADVGDYRKYPVYKTTAVSLLQHRPDFMPFQIMRDAPLIRSFGSREIGRAAVDAGHYLNKTFDFHSERFRFQFNPITLDKSGYFDYDIVRHAGAFYSLVRLYKASRKEEFFEINQKALDYLIKHITPPLLEPQLLGVQRNHNAKLGASALTLIAICELPEKLLNIIRTDRINRLARFLVEMQEADGRFYDFYWQRLLGYLPQRANAAFAGEALTALVRYYKINPNVEWLHAARMAADYQIQQYKTNGYIDNWTLQGLAELYEIDPDQRFADMAFEMAETLLEHQWGNPSNQRKTQFPDYLGGFDSSTPPRTGSTAGRLEALLAVHKLAFLIGRDPKPYADAVLAGTGFLLQNQYRRDNNYYVNLPDEVRGAFRGGPIDPEIEVDFCQHALVALSGAYDVAYMRETGTIPTEFQAEGTKELKDELEAGGKANP